MRNLFELIKSKFNLCISITENNNESLKEIQYLCILEGAILPSSVKTEVINYLIKNEGSSDFSTIHDAPDEVSVLENNRHSIFISKLEEYGICLKITERRK